MPVEVLNLTTQDHFSSQDGIDTANSIDRWLLSRNRSTRKPSRSPLAFDLATERKRVLRSGSNWEYFNDQIASYLEEAYGKVGVRNYEHLILKDNKGAERLYFRSGDLELARNSYQEIVRDATLPDWYIERGAKDLLWIDKVERILPDTPINSKLVDLSLAPFDVPLEERVKSGFGVHSFVRVHEVVLIDGQRRLVSKAIRHYLALEEQEKLFEILTGKFIKRQDLLGSVEKLDDHWTVSDIEGIIEKLYEQTPQERKINVPEKDLAALKNNRVRDILQKAEIQNWIKGIFTMMKSSSIPSLDVLKQFQGLEMAVLKLLNGEEVDLKVFEYVNQSAFVFSSFRQSQLILQLTEVEYKPLPGCDGIGSGLGSGDTIILAMPMSYQVMTIMSQLSPEDRKLFCIKCGACGKVIMRVVRKGEKCPKCPAIRECV